MFALQLKQDLIIRSSSANNGLRTRFHNHDHLQTRPASLSRTSVNFEKEVQHTIDKLAGPSNAAEFDRLQRADRAAGFAQFLAREARMDEEYWATARLRAESHWEGHETDCYVANRKRTFAEQEFNAMKRRYNSPMGATCKCIVMVKKEDRQSVVGTLDLSISYFSYGETFPGGQVRPSLFGLINRKQSCGYGYIANLCVAKSLRRQGIASNMLHFAILSARKHGVEKVFVHVYRNNKAAQVLYQKMGFQVVEEAISSADQTYLLSLDASKYFEYPPHH